MKVIKCSACDAAAEDFPIMQPPDGPEFYQLGINGDMSSEQAGHLPATVIAVATIEMVATGDFCLRWESSADWQTCDVILSSRTSSGDESDLLVLSAGSQICPKLRRLFLLDIDGLWPESAFLEEDRVTYLTDVRLGSARDGLRNLVAALPEELDCVTEIASAINDLLASPSQSRAEELEGLADTLQDAMFELEDHSDTMYSSPELLDPYLLVEHHVGCALSALNPAGELRYWVAQWCPPQIAPQMTWKGLTADRQLQVAQRIVALEPSLNSEIALNFLGVHPGTSPEVLAFLELNLR